MIKFLTYLFNKFVIKQQRQNDEFYLIKITLYYFFIWYLLAWGLFYLIYKNF
jgi:hypothetical protein